MLEGYASESEESPRSSPTPPPAKRGKKALPSLPSAFETAPKDEPALHQGRTRSRPYVQGDYNGHIYISLDLSKAFHDAIQRLVARVQLQCPSMTLHSFLDPSTIEPPSSREDSSNGRQRTGVRPPLHVSLTHPLPLRRSQIPSFRDEVVHALSTGSKAFKLSLAGEVRVYYNGRRSGGEGQGGRAFFALRVGAGSKEIEEMVERALHPILAKGHMPLYHDTPEFHASFAWCLIDQEGERELPTVILGDVRDEGDDGLDIAMSGEPGLSTSSRAAMISDGVLREINERFKDGLLATQSRGGWDIASVQLKIAKEVTSIPLHRS